MLRVKWRFEALGTWWEIATRQVISKDLKKTMMEMIERFDATYSRFRSDSLVAEIAQKAGTYMFPAEDESLFVLYETLHTLTKGRVTPLVGDALSSAGYDAQYSLKPQVSIAPVLSYDNIVQRNGTALTFKQPIIFDVGAAGKGLLVDKLVGALQAEGYDNFVVDASGDMRVVGRVEQVGIESPYNIEEVIGIVPLDNKALCASATNRRAWGEWHHIIDPLTLQPVRAIIATWVIADTAILADGLATALFFTDPKKLATTYNYEYLRLHANGSVDYSDYFAGRIFS